MKNGNDNEDEERERGGEREKRIKEKGRKARKKASLSPLSILVLTLRSFSLSLSPLFLSHCSPSAVFRLFLRTRGGERENERIKGGRISPNFRLSFAGAHETRALLSCYMLRPTYLRLREMRNLF